MELNDKVTQLEDEIKILKNEVQSVLLDLRESLMNVENPFNAAPVSANVNVSTSSQPAAPLPPPPPAAPNPAPAPVPNMPEPPAPEPAPPEPIVTQPPPPEPPDEVTDQDDALDEVEVTDPDEAEDEEDEVEEGELERAVLSRAPRHNRQYDFEDRSGSSFQFRPDRPGTGRQNGGEVSLATIAGLSRWVSDSSKHLGRERAIALLDISEVLGYLSVDLKKVMVKLIKQAPGGVHEEVSVQDYLTSLIKLDGILGKGSSSEVAMLVSALSGDRS